MTIKVERCKANEIYKTSRGSMIFVVSGEKWFGSIAT